ncbi:acyl-CoA dehydrogenase family protein [Actinomadura madurae]|nr:acyl-CoA dehydrogenase family protein [Actinomadura madurae]URN04672.1 acyl-CoA dehydrogenase family protein [Actinomadura madurae]
MSADVLASAELSAEFARWLAAHRTQATELSEAALRPAPAREYLDAQKTLQSWLYDEGWLARGWPKEYGGTGNDIGSRAAVYDLLGAADIAVPSTVNVVEILAPTLQRFAPGLAERMLPPLVAGAEAWCQGFSEPEAGSDLASLRTRATRTGQGWSLSGQKTWSTRAPGADRCAVLARTGSPESRHRGLSLFLVDMDSPGVECRPIDDMSFTQHFGEIFFDDVQVPDERRIGDVDGGWAVAQYLLQWERGMFSWLRQAALLGLLRQLPPGGRPRPGRGVSGRHRAPAAFAGHPAGTGGRPQRRPAGVDRQAAAVQGRAIRPRAGAPDAARRCRRRNSRLARPGARVPAQQVGADLRGIRGDPADDHRRPDPPAP